MDWVQIYTIVICTLQIGVSAVRDGQLRDDKEYKFRLSVVRLAVFLPLIGRVFGWW